MVYLELDSFKWNELFSIFATFWGFRYKHHVYQVRTQAYIPPRRGSSLKSQKID